MTRTMPGMIMKVALESMDKLVEEKEALRADLKAVDAVLLAIRNIADESHEGIVAGAVCSCSSYHDIIALIDKALKEEEEGA